MLRALEHAHTLPTPRLGDDTLNTAGCLLERRLLLLCWAGALCLGPPTSR